MKDFTMVIPSYWGRPGGGRIEGAETGKITFDHPTALNEEGTLGRLIESLDLLGPFTGTVVIIAVADEREIAPQVEEKIAGIVAPYKSRYDIRVLGQSAVDKINARLEAAGAPAEALAMVNLENYAAVRNICSLAGVLNSSAWTVFIDDDEVFTDPNFLEKIQHNMGRRYGGDTVRAIAGYYLQPDTYRLDETGVPDWRRPYWNNAAAMNEAFELIIGRGERLKPTPFVFGGNMALSLDALKKVPFDPRITRGEDIDFLLNLRINGITFYLDRELAIKHLPPGSQQEAWKKLREDTVRFLYERKKVLDHPQVLKLIDLEPYPAFFLGDDLDERIIKTCELLK
ncbi:MAG: hypothetical protein U9N45_03780, partial [Gemmatimonadota bacterium]|nr:hypothetical protein [Gemmatimonadota bacterium]